jgi:SOS-response transcriptional repressor LexA
VQTISLQHCNKRSVSISANLHHMEGLAEDHETVRALADWAKMAPSKLAAEAGLAATTLTRAFKGTATTRMSFATRQKLQSRFPDFPGWADRNGHIRSEVSGFGDRPFDEKFGAASLPQIPLMGTAIGIQSFDPEKQIELTEVNASEVLDHVARPASLARDKEAYALTVVGDSMWPRFRPGRRVIVSPLAPVSIGDDVVVQLRGTEGEGAYRDRITMVLIKELVRRTASYIELRQFNPDVTFRVDTDRVAKIHKVSGEVF